VLFPPFLAMTGTTSVGARSNEDAHNAEFPAFSDLLLQGPIFEPH